jgi:hypothetical protein
VIAKTLIAKKAIAKRAIESDAIRKTAIANDAIPKKAIANEPIEHAAQAAIVRAPSAPLPLAKPAKSQARILAYLLVFAALAYVALRIFVV